MSLQVFRFLLYMGNITFKEQNGPVLVEAKNSVLKYGHPLGQTEPVVQAATTKGLLDPKVAGFVFGKGRASRGREVMRRG